jgi:predicted transcriptional regulator
MKQTKFSTQVDEAVLDELKQYSEDSGKSISWIVNEAVAEYLERSRVRPAFIASMNRVLDKHADLMRRLAK